AHPQVARLVELEEIRDNRHNLSLPLYLTTEKTRERDVSAALLQWQASRSNLHEQTERLLQRLAEVGYGDP
nr:SAM-dependent DNA methyltransferase [Ardenticatenales bacterium]